MIFVFVIFFFQLITLPVEFNASKRAVEAIRSSNFSNDDIYGVKKVLTAAALTYVAALLTSLLYLLHYVSIFIGMGRDDR